MHVEVQLLQAKSPLIPLLQYMSKTSDYKGVGADRGMGQAMLDLSTKDPQSILGSLIAEKVLRQMKDREGVEIESTYRSFHLATMHYGSDMYDTFYILYQRGACRSVFSLPKQVCSFLLANNSAGFICDKMQAVV